MRLNWFLAVCLGIGCSVAMSATEDAPDAPKSGSLDPSDAPKCGAKEGSNPNNLGKCIFDRTKLSFQGSAIDQAKCLLRTVTIGGKMDSSPLKNLPAPLNSLVGKPVGISAAELSSYLKARHIDEGDLGGPLTRPVSTGNNNAPDSAQARYFVIHDTSTPNYLVNKPGPRPANIIINSESYEYNDLTMWQKGCKSKAHVFVSRTGKSLTTVQFETAWRATRLELDYVGLPAMGLFLHVENVQPREHDPNPKLDPENDRKAPTPGFTKAQVARLALVYVAASVRRGEWLIPAFHTAIDEGIPGGHDDPQNFVLREWACQVHAILVSLKKLKGLCK
jgi:hypothetical protein